MSDEGEASFCSASSHFSLNSRGKRRPLASIHMLPPTQASKLSEGPCALTLSRQLPTSDWSLRRAPLNNDSGRSEPGGLDTLGSHRSKTNRAMSRFISKQKWKNDDDPKWWELARCRRIPGRVLIRVAEGLRKWYVGHLRATRSLAGNLQYSLMSPYRRRPFWAE